MESIWNTKNTDKVGCTEHMINVTIPKWIKWVNSSNVKLTASQCRPGKLS